ncbi:thioesterase II family protein [Streptomyces sp. NPDC051569]|uniref:thioesterase II family protein n=1 Tax=Streptomyces sp. NPDC051569 TaxID=3365661 RepID=UPI0037B12772
MSPFVRPRPTVDPSLRVFGFHHAGGSAAVYHPMNRVFPADWELLLLDLPGRGKRHGERPLERLDEVVARAVADIEPWLDGAPVALFGHSFGALVALEVGRALEREGHPPIWVGVSGRVPPSHQPVTRLSALDDEGLMREMVAMGGMPERVSEIPEFVERFLRIIRSDLRAAESYEPAPDRVPLSCPLTVFCGTDDAWAAPSAMSGWSRETRYEPRREVFPGGHFYFLGAALEGFARTVTGEIRAVAAMAGN